MNEIDRLKEENQRLKEENERLKKDEGLLFDAYTRMRKERDSLLDKMRKDLIAQALSVSSKKNGE